MAIDESYANYKLPEDFNPTFEKEYTKDDVSYLIKVQYHGIVTGEHKHVGFKTQKWIFQISVAGKQICGGVYHWDVSKREINDENCANHLASFWGDYPEIRWAQPKPTPLDIVVEKCARFMHDYFLRQSGDNIDYDIVTKLMTEDENEWTVILRPNYIRNRLLEFYNVTADSMTEVRSYIEDNVMQIDL